MGTVSKGKLGERKAVEYLRGKGYEILFTNYRYGHKEIDVIATDGKYVVFVEVKAGKSKSFGPPKGWVDAKKQKKLADVAKSFLQKYQFPGYDFRFDVIAIDTSSKISTVEHIQNAFSLD